MIPTSTGHSGRNDVCMSLCVASILEIPGDDVPVFVEPLNDGKWHDRFHDWLDEQGWDESWTWIETTRRGKPKGWHQGYWIAAVDCDPPEVEWNHAIVMLNTKPVFDCCGVKEKYKYQCAYKLTRRKEDMSSKFSYAVGDFVHVKLGGRGRPPLGEIKSVYASGDLKVKIVSGQRTGDIVRVTPESVTAA